MRHRLVALALTVLVPPAAADDPQLSRPELAKKGKPSAVCVLVDRVGTPLTGTGFVVHPDGLIVASSQVVNPVGTVKGVQVVVNARLPGQQVLKATVVRADRDTDLALLRVEPPAPLPALELGDAESLSELTELVGFGFPRSIPPTLAADQVPPVTVTVSSISSLHRKNNVLFAAQLDAGLDLGYLGGPMLGKNGKVMGIVSCPVNAGRAERLVPANALRAFLAAPDLTLTLPPAPGPTDLSKPATFTATVKFPLPTTDKPSLELGLDLGDGTPRTVPMTREGGVYRATAVLLPSPAVEQVTLAARFGRVTLTGPVADRAFRVGDTLTALSKVRTVSAGAAVLLDGTRLTGQVTGLDGVPFAVAGREVPLDLARADSVTVTSPVRPASLTCTVVARLAGKEIGRVNQTLSLGPPVVDPGPALLAADMEAGKVVRKLPETYSDVCMGGGGRYLFFFFPRLAQIGCFDVTQTRIVHYFPAADPAAKFAAGADKLVIVLPSQSVIQRWDLTTRQRELTLTVDDKVPVHKVALGHASAGPVLVNNTFLDLATLRPIPPAKSSTPASHRSPGDKDNRVRASADGAVFGVWATGTSPSGLQTVVFNRGEVTSFYEHESAGHVVPGPDGRFVYTGIGVYTRELKPQTPDGKKPPYALYLPAAHGNMYFTARPIERRSGQPDPKAVRIDVSLAGDHRVLATLGTLDGEYDTDRWGRELIGGHKRLWLIPDAKVFVSLPATNDTVELTRFDLDEALTRAGIDYLFVASEPSPTARRGVPYIHQLVVKSKRGGVKYKLDAGPPGLTLSPTGRIDWPSPDGGPATVIIAVADASGQQVFKSVVIQVEPGQ